MESLETLIDSSEPTYINLSNILKNIIDSCSINQTKYYIIGSYTIRKEREREGRPIGDLDVIMAPDEFNKLKDFGMGEFEEFTGNSGKTTERFSITVEKDGKEYPIEIFNLPESEGIPTNELSMEALQGKKGSFTKDKNGHLMFSPITLLKWKESMNRKKNQADIAILRRKLHRTHGGKVSRKISTRRRRKSLRKV
jgi:hypothetical protein